MLKKWETLPEYMQNDEVRFYYETLQKKKVSMFLKRVMDLVGGLIPVSYTHLTLPTIRLV